MKNLKRFNSSFIKIIILIIFTSIIVSGQGENDIQLNNKKILFLGNSITQEGAYVSFTDYYLQSMFPKKNYDIISIGLSSETASGLTEPSHPFPRPCIHERLKRVLEKIKPDIVIACYGMNDGIYYPQSDKRFQAYKDGMLKLIRKLKSVCNQMIILTPPIFDPKCIPQKIRYDNAREYGYAHPYYLYDNVLADYSKWIMSLKIEGVKTIDLHDAMKKYIKQRRLTDSTFRINKDGVHPTQLGHLFMAEVLLNGLGIPLKVTNLNKKLNEVKADTLFQLVNKQRQIRSKGWLEYIGYTRGKTVKIDNIEPTEKKLMNCKNKLMN